MVLSASVGTSGCCVGAGVFPTLNNTNIVIVFGRTTGQLNYLLVGLAHKHMQIKMCNIICTFIFILFLV